LNLPGALGKKEEKIKAGAPARAPPFPEVPWVRPGVFDICQNKILPNCRRAAACFIYRDDGFFADASPPWEIIRMNLPPA